MDETALTQVLDAAEELVGDRGFYRVTLEDVAAQASVEAGDVTSEFADMQALVVRLAQVRAHELRTHLHKAVVGLSSRSMMEGAGFQAYFEWIAKHPYVNQVLRQAELIDKEAFRNWYRDLAADYARGLAQAMDEGEIPHADPETLAYCLMGIGEALGMRYVLWPGRSELPADVARTFQRVVMRSLGAPTGR